MVKIRSIKQVNLIFEIISMVVILTIFLIAGRMLQLKLENQMIQNLDNTMATVEHSINIYLNERLAEFERIAKSKQLEVSSQYFDAFSDLYVIDDQQIIQKIYKSNANSHIFVGYGISQGVLADFVKNTKTSTAVFSPILRSVESDSVSIYLVMPYHQNKLVARIGFEEIRQYIERIAESYESILIISSPEGYIITSSQKELPFKIVPDQNAFQILFEKPYFLTKRDSKLLGNKLVLMTPLEKVNGPLAIFNQFIPIFAIAVIVTFVLRLYVVTRVLIMPLRRFIYQINEYDPNSRQSGMDLPILQTKEVIALYEAFHIKTKEIEETFERINIARELAMNQLVEAEKLSSLGGLVAGVAHEINTPIGVCVTTASFLTIQNQAIEQQFLDGSLKKNSLATYFKDVNEAMAILNVSLERAAELIKSFKQIAVEQSSEIEVDFDFEELVQVVLLSLKHELKRQSHQAVLKIKERITIVGQPGAYHQIFTNLIMNAIIHGFRNKSGGIITIEAITTPGQLIIRFEDNGCGIPNELQKKVFDPFFTTNRENGGSGLGLHIVYNLVVNKLSGSIKIQNSESNGALFVIMIPLKK